jgi:hypothetical protein
MHICMSDVCAYWHFHTPRVFPMPLVDVLRFLSQGGGHCSRSTTVVDQHLRRNKVEEYQKDLTPAPHRIWQYLFGQWSLGAVFARTYFIQFGGHGSRIPRTRTNLNQGHWSRGPLSNWSIISARLVLNKIVA